MSIDTDDVVTRANYVLANPDVLHSPQALRDIISELLVWRGGSSPAVSGEVIGETCIDGGHCHHNCKSGCFRRICCSPFSDYKGPWKYDEGWPPGKLDRNPWETAVDHLLTDWGMTASNYDTPLDAVRGLIKFEVQAALDPKVSTEADKLVRSVIERSATAVLNLLLDPAAEVASAVDGEGWIEWKGDDKPPFIGLADIKFRSIGKAMRSTTAKLRWTHIGEGADIVAYRVAR